MPLVNIRTFEEALSIVLTSHNITPRRELFGQTPLAFYSDQLETQWFPYQPKFLRNEIQPFLSRKKVPIIFHDNSQAPHINFCYLKYKGPALTDILKHDKNVYIKFDRRDIRSLEVLDLAGNLKGKVYAPKTWQQFPHSINTRQEIMKLIRKDHLQKEHPLSEYLRTLINKSNKPDTALKLLKIHTEFNPEDEALICCSSEPNNAKSKRSKSLKNSVTWSSKLARKKESYNESF